jgi:hypothetical protein
MSKRQGYVKSLGKLIRFVQLKLHTTLIQHFSCYLEYYCKGNLELSLRTWPVERYLNVETCHFGVPFILM